jgi:hypothetical protein
VPPDVRRWAVKQVHPLSRPVVKNHEILDTLKGASVRGIHSVAGALPILVEEAAKLGCSRPSALPNTVPVRVSGKTSADRPDLAHLGLSCRHRRASTPNLSASLEPSSEARIRCYDELDRSIASLYVAVVTAGSTA